MAQAPIARIAATTVLVALVAATAVTGTMLDTEAEPVRVQAPRDGDAWHYVQQDFDNGTPLGDPVVRSFERIGAATVVGPDGGQLGGSGVVERRVDASPCGTPVQADVLAVAAAGISLGHHATGVGAGGCASNAIITGVADPRQSIERYSREEVAFVGADPLPCGHTNTLAGNEAAETVLAAGDCGGMLRLLGTDEGMLVYEDPAGQQVWFREDVPVPVLIRRPMDDHVRVLALDGFEPGGEPMRTAADQPGPGLALRPAVVGRPDDAGFDLGFPLDDAIAAGRQDDAFDALLDAGFLMEATYSTVDVESPGGDRIQRTWELRATDGQKARGITVTSTERHDDQAATLPIWEATREARTEVTVGGGFWPDGGPFPNRALLPPRMPGVADAVALWQDLGGTGANAYGFSHACAGENCTTLATHLIVGRIAGHRAEDVCVGFSCLISTAWEKDTLTVDAAGNVVATHRWDRVEAREFTLEPRSAEAPDDPGSAVASFSDPAAFMPLPVAAGITAAAILAGIAYILHTLSKSGMLALWHRQLDHPVRQQIMHLVHEEPGIHHKELMRRLDRGNHVVSHHLRRLVAADLVAQQAGARFTCYFPKGRVDRRVMAAVPVLKSDVAHRMLQLIAQRPGRSGKDLAEALGIVPGNVTFHAKRMREAGLIEVGREGRSLAYRATAVGQQALRVGIAA